MQKFTVCVATAIAVLLAASSSSALAETKKKPHRAASSPIIFTKHYDKGSPYLAASKRKPPPKTSKPNLMNKAATGKHFKKATMAHSKGATTDANCLVFPSFCDGVGGKKAQ
jgi:type VI protein secretion system component Hcp